MSPAFMDALASQTEAKSSSRNCNLASLGDDLSDAFTLDSAEKKVSQVKLTILSISFSGREGSSESSDLSPFSITCLDKQKRSVYIVYLMNEEVFQQTRYSEQGSLLVS
jgi:hypothetical protein